MKFKSIFFLFNGIILFSFLFVALMPLVMLGGDYTLIFWKENWFLGLIFLSFICVLDWYFIHNWKLFTFLENEDWANLISYLEVELYEKKRFSNRNIRMMVNTALSVSNIQKVDRLRCEIQANKPELLGPFGYLLGIPYLLNSNTKEGIEFYDHSLVNAKPKEKGWLIWSSSFLKLSAGIKDLAVADLTALCRDEKDRVRQLLSLYLISSSQNGALSPELEEMKSLFLKKFPTNKSFERDVNRAKANNIVVLLLSSVLDDSLKWVYGAK